jgi:predicted unusual protein kinase regulating ubiquinone biosynthesis (AarF/ABC1/UbiB family)
MATVDQTLTASFGPDWKDNLELDPKPIGAGCIAQVFRGKLRTVKKASDADSPVYKSRFGLFSRRRRTLLKGSSNEDDTALVATETPVAVKLIHPHVESLIKIDMEMLNLLANFMDR